MEEEWNRIANIFVWNEKFIEIMQKITEKIIIAKHNLHMTYDCVHV